MFCSVKKYIYFWLGAVPKITSSKQNKKNRDMSIYFLNKHLQKKKHVFTLPLVTKKNTLLLFFKHLTLSRFEILICMASLSRFSFTPLVIGSISVLCIMAAHRYHNKFICSLVTFLYTPQIGPLLITLLRSVRPTSCSLSGVGERMPTAASLSEWCSFVAKVNMFIVSGWGIGHNVYHKSHIMCIHKKKQLPFNNNKKKSHSIGCRCTNNR